MGFGTRFKASSRAGLRRSATPGSAGGPEAIFHQFYDTQLYTSAATVRQTFFNNTSADPTISNMQAAGQFPDPQYFSLYDITLDFLPATAYVSTAATANTGNINDYGLLLMTARPTWTLVLSDKRYGPYSLSALHGTGGVQGFLALTAAATNNAQYGHNNLNSGWNYYGSIIIPPKTNFFIEVNYAAAQTLAGGNPNLRISLFGLLSRRSL